MTSVLDQFRQWPVEDQVDFIHKAWDELDEAGWQPPLTSEQKAELDQRVAAYLADPSNVWTWETLRARLGIRDELAE